MTKKKARTEVVRVRMTEYESLKLKAFAYGRGQSMSHILREYVRRLPSPTQPEPDVPNA